MRKISIKKVMRLIDDGCPVEMRNGDFPGDCAKARICGIVFDVVWPSEDIEITINNKPAGKGRIDMPIFDGVVREVKCVDISKIEEA